MQKGSKSFEDLLPFWNVVERDLLVAFFFISPQSLPPFPLQFVSKTLSV